MQRCMTCSAVMTPKETTCLACGSVIRTDDKKMKTARALKITTDIIFWVSVATGVVALFFGVGPPWKGSAMVAVLVRVLRSSAAQMVEKTD